MTKQIRLNRIPPKKISEYNLLIGMRFNRLVIISYLTKSVGNGFKTFFECQCDCGNKSIVRLSDITKPRPTQSCGCHDKEQITKRFTTHGKSYANVYRSYNAMLWRNNPENKQDFKYYKDVGIDDRWIGESGFVNFLADMGEPPTGHTLDRIDNCKPYSPQNCRWASRKTQAQNRRNTIYITLNGLKVKLSDACIQYGVRYESVLAAKYRNGCEYEASIIRLSKRHKSNI